MENKDNLWKRSRARFDEPDLFKFKSKLGKLGEKIGGKSEILKINRKFKN